MHLSKLERVSLSVSLRNVYYTDNLLCTLILMLHQSVWRILWGDCFGMWHLMEILSRGHAEILTAFLGMCIIRIHTYRMLNSPQYNIICNMKTHSTTVMFSYTEILISAVWSKSRRSSDSCPVLALLCYRVHSMVVKVRRGCMSKRRWTAVDYSGCTLSSNNDLVFVITSLWATVTNTSDDNDTDVTLDLPALEGQVQQLMSSLLIHPCIYNYNIIVHFTIYFRLH